MGLRITLQSALNTAFSDWGNILFNTTIATAIADRLVENSEIFLLGGESLRKAQKSPPPSPS
jgi:DNA replication protein DnaC